MTLRFALSLVGRGAAAPPAIDFGDGGWSSLIEALKVRDRLVHPKVTGDLLVKDEELQTVRRGRMWFVTTYEALDRAVQRAIAEKIMENFREWRRNGGEG